MGTGQSFRRTCDIIEEETWGATPASPTAYQMRVNDIQTRVTQRVLTNAVYRGDRLNGSPFRDVLSCGLTVKAPIYLDEVGWWLKHGIAEALQGGSSGARTHTGKVGYSDDAVGDLPVGLSIEIGYTDLGTAQFETFTGCRVDSVVIPFGPAGPAELTIGLVGQDQTFDTTTKDAAPTTYTSAALSHTDISSMIEGGGGSPTETTICLGGEIRVANNLDTTVHTVNNSGQLGDLPSGRAAVTGTVRFLFQDLTHLNKALNATESNLGVTWTSGSDSLAITIPELKYHRSSPVPGSGSGLIADLEFEAFYGNHADATLLKYVLSNTTYNY